MRPTWPRASPHQQLPSIVNWTLHLSICIIEVMNDPLSTAWTIIADAAAGKTSAREEFASKYLPTVRSYLGARWSGSALSQQVDDAAQDVFIECFRADGPLDRVSESKTKSFRAYLYGVTRNVARRYEHKVPRDDVGHARISQIDVPANETSLSQVFDRAWARSIMKQAGQRHREIAMRSGDAAIRRLELLELRFREGLPIRHIADQWDTDAAQLHREYSKARTEFRQALLDVIRFHNPGSATEIQIEAKSILGLLS